MTTKKIVLILSGKGGVGKSSTAVQLALSAYLSDPAAKVGLLDIDLCGPSVPRMLHIDEQKVLQTSEGWIPAYLDGSEHRFGVMSIGFLLPTKDSAIVWRGPKKCAMIKQFIESVVWGDLDYLFIDTPPGTSDEHLAVIEALAGSSPSAVIVTTPQLVAISDVDKEISFCNTVELPIEGVIENMSGYKCGHCSHTTNIFSSGGGEQLAAKHSLKFLGRAHISPQFSRIIEKSYERPLDMVEEYSSCDLYPVFKAIFSEIK